MQSQRPQSLDLNPQPETGRLDRLSQERVQQLQGFCEPPLCKPQPGQDDQLVLAKVRVGEAFDLAEAGPVEFLKQPSPLRPGLGQIQISMCSPQGRLHHRGDPVVDGGCFRLGSALLRFLDDLYRPRQVPLCLLQPGEGDITDVNYQRSPILEQLDPFIQVALGCFQTVPFAHQLTQPTQCSSRNRQPL